MTCHGPFRKSRVGFEKGDAALAGDEDGGRKIRAFEDSVVIVVGADESQYGDVYPMVLRVPFCEARSYVV